MKYTLIIISICFLSACVPGRRFDRVNNAYNICKADSLRYSDSLKQINKQNGELILKVVSLQQDSIKKGTEFFSLQEQYNNLLTNGSAEMATILRRMKQSEEEARRQNSNRSSVVLHKGEIDKALDKIYNELTVNLYGIDKRNISVIKTNFAVKISINEAFLFTKPSTAISSRGSKVIDAIAQMFKERNLFNIHLVKNIPVGELFGKMNNAQTSNIINGMSTLDKKISDIDKQIEITRANIAKINADYKKLTALDSILLVKRDSMMIAINDAQELSNLMLNRIEIKYNDPKIDSLNASKAKNTLLTATQESSLIESERNKTLISISKNRTDLKTKNSISDSLSQIRNIEIESLNKIMNSIEAITEVANARELDILTSFIIKSCGGNLGDNKITTERVFRADGTLDINNRWIDIIMKPEIENIVGQQKNKNIYD